jgi:hypothetical protein
MTEDGRFVEIPGRARFQRRVPVHCRCNGGEELLAFGGIDREHAVVWLHTLVAADSRQTFWLYDAPSPEAIRKSAARNGLPVGVMTQVTVFDPSFYMRVTSPSAQGGL